MSDSGCSSREPAITRQIAPPAFDLGSANGERRAKPPRREGLDDGDVREAFYRALTAAGLGHLRELDEPIVFHDLRHTFGTLAVQVWPVTDVQAYMGHADIKTTMRYVHHVPKHDAAERFSRFVDGQLGVSPLCPEPTASNATERNSAQLAAA
jgi:integrase